MAFRATTRVRLFAECEGYLILDQSLTDDGSEGPRVYSGFLLRDWTSRVPVTTLDVSSVKAYAEAVETKTINIVRLLSCSHYN
jgi:hypothetical protein